jgi:hypothetical protein
LPHWPCDTPLPAKFGINFADIDGCSVGVVRWRSKTTELVRSPLPTLVYPGSKF